MSESKTDNIKKRRIDVYLPTYGEKKRWLALAKKQGMSVSRWIIAVVENAINSFAEHERNRKKLQEMEREVEALKEEVAELDDKLKVATILKERYEKELRRYRAQPFLDPHFRGIRKYDKELVNLLRSSRGEKGKPRTLTDQEILRRLKIDPREEEAVKAISIQLSNLESYGLVISSTKGWRWVD